LLIWLAITATLSFICLRELGLLRMLGRTPRAERVKIKIKRFMIASQEDGLV
jgi:hypothetical protein